MLHEDRLIASSNQASLVNHQDVITLCDYETCPTVKSIYAINTIIVVKFDGNLQSFEAGRDHSDYDHYEPLENRAVGVLPNGQRPCRHPPFGQSDEVVQVNNPSKN